MPNLGTFMPRMGSTSRLTRAAPSLADALFTRTQQRVLALLFGQPARSFYANELISLAGMGSGAVQRELARPGYRALDRQPEALPSQRRRAHL